MLDHQIALQKDIDDKALRTVRLSIVLIALVVSVAQLMEPDQLAALETWTLIAAGAGVLGLSISVFVGLGVYVETDVPFGVGSDHRREVRAEGYSETEWLDLLLSEYDDWTGDALASNEVNASWLGRAQASTIVGVGYLCASVLALTTSVSAAVTVIGCSVVGGIALLLYFVRTRERA